ncbi:MAG: hypothetical protein WCP55_18790 [Lentisphaerota bacterium]
MRHTVMSFTFLVGVLLSCSGCGTFHAMTYDGHNTYRAVEAANYGITRNFPKTFTVYPFKNTSWYREAADRGREAIYQAFTLIGPCTRLDETEKIATLPYTASDALKVARQQNNDAVIVGEVMSQDHLWFFLFSYSYVMIKINIYDTKDGRLLYSGNAGETDSDFSLISLVDHINWSRITQGLYYRCAMDFVHDIRPDVTATR